MNGYNKESAMLKGFIRPLLIGILVGILVCLGALMLLSAAATTIDIPVAAVVPLATVATALGAFFSGFSSAKVSGRNGWLMGLLSSLVLYAVSMFAGTGLFDQMDGSFAFTKALIMLACGMVGGILAVNSGKQRRKR